MTKHTPGDWTFNPKTGDISAPDGQTVGYAASHRREREANGQLFAASPKLLVALKAYETEYENLEDRAPAEPFCGECNIGAGPHKRTCAHHLARAAIAEAEGRS